MRHAGGAQRKGKLVDLELGQNKGHPACGIIHVINRDIFV